MSPRSWADASEGVSRFIHVCRLLFPRLLRWLLDVPKENTRPGRTAITTGGTVSRHGDHRSRHTTTQEPSRTDVLSLRRAFFMPIGLADEPTPRTLTEVRSTHVFGREDGQWRAVHRHADPKSPESSD